MNSSIKGSMILLYFPELSESQDLHERRRVGSGSSKKLIMLCRARYFLPVTSVSKGLYFGYSEAVNFQKIVNFLIALSCFSVVSCFILASWFWRSSMTTSVKTLGTNWSNICNFVTIFSVSISRSRIDHRFYMISLQWSWPFIVVKACSYVVYLVASNKTCPSGLFESYSNERNSCLKFCGFLITLSVNLPEMPPASAMSLYMCMIVPPPIWCDRSSKLKILMKTSTDTRHIFVKELLEHWINISSHSGIWEAAESTFCRWIIWSMMLLYFKKVSSSSL